VRERIDHADLPLDEWTSLNTPDLHPPIYEGGGEPDPVLERVFEEPGVRASIAELFGSDELWDRQRNYYLFVKAYNPDSKPALSPKGHIDFSIPPAPPLYRGFAFQVSLVDTEPFSGNLTVHPGGHIAVQKALITGNDRDVMPNVPQDEPWEFVARAGDALFVHHLTPHSGNPSHSANRRPRVTLFCEAYCHAWTPSIDPATPGLGPWHRSLAQNGPYQADPLNERRLEELRRKYVRDLRVESEKKKTTGSPN
jgi:hypothetical protein